MIVTVPIRIESTPNLRESWQERSRRSGKHKQYVCEVEIASHAL